MPSHCADLKIWTHDGASLHARGMVRPYLRLASPGHKERPVSGVPRKPAASLAGSRVKAPRVPWMRGGGESRTKTFLLRLSTRELMFLEELATRDGIPASAVLRRAIWDAIAIERRLSWARLRAERRL